MIVVVVAMSRRKAVQFSRAGFNAGDGGDDGGGGGVKVAEDSAVKKPSLKEGREDTAFIFANLSAVTALNVVATDLVGLIFFEA